MHTKRRFPPTIVDYRMWTLRYPLEETENRSWFGNRRRGTGGRHYPQYADHFGRDHSVNRSGGTTAVDGDDSKKEGVDLDV